MTDENRAAGRRPDALTYDQLLRRLPEQLMRRVVCVDRVGSTNDRLRELAEEGAQDGAVLVANGQTGGRGRFGRSFDSPADMGIYLSMLLRPTGDGADVAGLTGCAAVAAANAVEAVCGVRPGIKWVNDLLLDGKKLCGILTELAVEGATGHIGYAVIGVGINVRQAEEDFPPELRDAAASIYSATGRLISRAELCCALIRELDALRLDWPHRRGEYLAAYRRGCVTVGRQVTVISPLSERPAFAESVDDSFGLNVRYADGGRETVSSGEVSLRPPRRDGLV